MTQRVGIVGWPIEHSLSPIMHRAAFVALAMDDWTYEAMAVPPDIARLAFSEPQRSGFIGLNVTLPFKQEAMGYCRPDELARAVGAVNTIDFRDDTGTNTDVHGFISDLQANDIELAEQQVIVLGAGGAARAAVYGLWQQGAHIHVINRTPERAQQMIDQLMFSAGVRGVQLANPDHIRSIQPALIVNATSVGMSPRTVESPLPDKVVLAKNVVGYDMVYNPETTRFMTQITEMGGRAIGGAGMLVRQGAESFRIWTGAEPPLDVMFSAVRGALQAGKASAE